MNTILYLVIYYLFFLLLWGTICVVAYALTIALNKPTIIKAVSGFAQIIAYIFYFLLGFYLLYVLLKLFLTGGFLIAFLIIVFGGILFGLIGSFFHWLTIPFYFIPIYLGERIGKDFEESNVVAGEILDKEGKVIGKTEGKAAVNKRLATLFLADYILIIVYVYLNKEKPQYVDFKIGDYITTPIIWLLSEVILFGIFVLIYYKLRYKKFLPFGKKELLIKILKIDIVITGVLTLFSALAKFSG